MKIRWMLLMFCCMGLLAGCASITSGGKGKSKAKPVENSANHPIRFPGYFYIKGFHLNEHGRMPHTSLIGAGMTADRDLAEVRSEYQNQLSAHDWKTDMMETAAQSFRIMASHAGETVEIRAVQGTSGPTQIFLIYTPARK